MVFGFFTVGDRLPHAEYLEAVRELEIRREKTQENNLTKPRQESQIKHDDL
jgi:hypothetical protein